MPSIERGDLEISIRSTSFTGFKIYQFYNITAHKQFLGTPVGRALSRSPITERRICHSVFKTEQMKRALDRIDVESKVFFSYVPVPSGIDLIRCKKRNRYFCSVLMFFESVYPKTSKQCNFLI